MKHEDEQYLSATHFSCEQLEMYYCQYCNFSTDLIIILKKHFQDYHTRKRSSSFDHTVQSYICKRCSFETHFSLSWLKHEINGCFANQGRHPQEKLTDFDDSHCDNPIEIKPTDRKSTRKKNFSCEFCSYESPWQHHVLGHIRRKHSFPEDQNFACELCPYITRHDDYLKQHIRRKHTTRVRGKWYNCQHCPFTTEFNSWLKRHELKHEQKMESRPIRPFRCTYCTYGTHFKIDLKRHTLIKHTPMDIIWLKCDLCDFQTKTRNSLNTHILNKHTPEEDIRWFECDLCTFKTKLNTTLTRHKLRKHRTGDEVAWYHCKICPYKSKVKNDLRSHEISHTGVKPTESFPCDQCSFVTKRKHTLIKHKIRKHLKEDEINWLHCKLCPFTAKMRCDLKNHEFLVHSNESFKCDQCDFTSKWKVDLKCHKIRKHLKDDEVKWFHCKICKYKGKFQSSLTKHVAAVHLKVKKERKKRS